jgi:hypothetical protein
MLTELRRILNAELGNLTLSLWRIERGTRMQLQLQREAAGQLDGLITRSVRLERAIGVVEDPVAPRVSRRQSALA